MRTSVKLGALVLSGVFIVGACGGDDGPTGTNSGDQLSAAEVDALLESELGDLIGDLLEFNAGDFGFGPSRTAPGLPSGLNVAAAVPIDVSINASAPCDAGGTVSVNGRVTGNFDVDSTSGFRIDFNETFDITEGFTDCRVTSGTGQLTVNGDPNLRLAGSVEGSLTLNQTNPALSSVTLSGSITLRGGIRFDHSDGRRGTCAFDLTVSFSQTAATESGTICGIDVSQL